MTDSRDDLLNSLVAVSIAVQEALPGRVSSPVLQPPTAGLDWSAGVALQRILEAGITAEMCWHSFARCVSARSLTVTCSLS